MFKRNLINLPKRNYAYASLNKIPLQVCVSKVNDPYINSSIEEYIFRLNDPSKQTLFMWQNNPAVIFGRYQNPYKECNLQNIEKDDVCLIRRYSGGGAVYQDLGNTNFSFISSKSLFDKNKNYNIVLNALKKFGIDAQIKGRNDIVVNDKKISGSAFKIAGDIAIHHGTLLLDVNMANLSKYLNPNKRKLESKGVASVQSRVTNLKDISMNINNKNITETIINEFFESYNNECKVINYDFKKINLNFMNNPNFLKILEGYKDWNWTFGKTPEFKNCVDNRFDWGCIEVCFTSNCGIIEDIVIYSDSLFPEMIDLLNVHLKNKKHDKSGIDEAIELSIQGITWLVDMNVSDKEDCKKFIREFGEWFSSVI